MESLDLDVCPLVDGAHFHDFADLAVSSLVIKATIIAIALTLFSTIATVVFLTVSVLLLVTVIAPYFACVVLPALWHELHAQP